MFKPADANVSVYAKEYRRGSDITVYYPGTVYEGDAGYLPRLSKRPWGVCQGIAGRW